MTGFLARSSSACTLLLFALIGSVIPAEASTVPAPPEDVRAIGHYQSATVYWTAPASDGGSPITGYRITTSPAPQNPEPAVRTVGPEDRNVVVNRLNNGAVYKFIVVSMNIFGDSAPIESNAVVPDQKPSQPLNVAATPGPDLGEVSLGWEPPTTDGGSVDAGRLGIAGYEIYRGLTADNLQKVAQLRDPGCCSYIDRGLTPGTKYYYAISAVANYTYGFTPEGPLSDIVSATPPAAVVAGSTWYSDGSKSNTGPAGTPIRAYAVGALEHVPYRLVLGTGPGDRACLNIVQVVNDVVVFAGPNGLIGRVSGAVQVGVLPGTYKLCFEDASTGNLTGTGGATFTITS